MLPRKEIQRRPPQCTEGPDAPWGVGPCLGRPVGQRRQQLRPPPVGAPQKCAPRRIRKGGDASPEPPGKRGSSRNRSRPPPIRKAPPTVSCKIHHIER